MSWADIPDLPITRPTTPRARGVAWAGLALLLGIGSILMGFLAALNFAFFVVYHVWMQDPGLRTGPSWRTNLFIATSHPLLTMIVGWVAVAWLLGFAGNRLGLARREAGPSASLAASAVRFSRCGLIGVGLDVAILLGMLAYRLNRWYFG